MKKNLMTLLGAALALTLPLAAGAQAYPERPVRVLHGFAAGGNADVVARLVATEMAKGGPIAIRISTDGVGEVHDRIRNHKGCFEKIMRTVRGRAPRRRSPTRR